MNPKERLEKFVSERGIKKPKTCRMCNHWKVNKNDKLQREHASQGRALCGLDNRLGQPFLHHTNPACDKISIVDLETEVKRIKYLEGK